MGIPILLRWHLYIESAPWSLYWSWPQSDWANNRMGCGTRHLTTGGTLIQWRSFKVMSGCKVLPQLKSKFIVNTLRLRQDGRHFADGIFKCIFLNENVWIPIKISLKFVPEGPINNIPAMVQIMAWRHPGDKPLSEPMVVSLPTHICVARPQWVNIMVC